MEFSKLTIKKFASGLRDKEFSAEEITSLYLKNISQNDEKIGAYLSTYGETARKSAQAIDALLAKGEDLSPLAGVPLGVKDNILIKGMSATAASKKLENYIASYDATVMRRLKDKKTIVIGKTNMDEFAMGSSTEHSAYHVTRNPHDTERVPGGSSGGSAAAVAADMALATLGSDTFGSVRQPASFCGVVGLKPTYGAVSRHGLIAMGSSLDQIGPITKTVEDAAILFDAMRGKDTMDSTSADLPSDDLLSPDSARIKNLTIGLPKEYFISGIDSEVSDAIENTISDLKEAGFKFKEVSLPHTKYAAPCYYVIMPAEVSANLARFDGVRYARDPSVDASPISQRGSGFGVETKRRIILGSFVLSAGHKDAYYKKAQTVRTLIRQDFVDAFKEVDVLLTPVAPTPAFKLGEKTSDPVEMYLSDIFTGAANLAGVPAISIPTKGRDGKLPIGFQLIGRHFDEASIVGIGRAYEGSL